MTGNGANDATATGSLLIELLGALPPFLWFGLLVILLLRYRAQIASLFRRLTAFKGMGVEVEFAEASINDAVADRARFLTETAIQPGMKADAAHRIEVPKQDLKRAIARVRASLELLEGKRILWVDDIPLNNRNELRMFRSLGIASDAVISTQDAIERLERDETQFDLIISDMSRDGDNKAGLELIADYGTLVTQQNRAPDDRLPLIFYIGNYNPTVGTPAGAFGITNRPDQLLHLVIDALAQAKR